MPDKTHAEQLRELNTTVASLSSRLDAYKDSQQRLLADFTTLQTVVHDQAVSIALIDQRVAVLTKDAEEAKRWRWSLVGPIVAAVISSLLTALLGLLILNLRH